MPVCPATPPHQQILSQLHQKYPDAPFFTPSMIAPLVGLAPRTMRYYCKKYISAHNGHYRFWPDSKVELEQLLKIIVCVKK